MRSGRSWWRRSRRAGTCATGVGSRRCGCGPMGCRWRLSRRPWAVRRRVDATGHGRGASGERAASPKGCLRGPSAGWAWKPRASSRRWWRTAIRRCTGMRPPPGPRPWCAPHSPNGAGPRANGRCGARCIGWATATSVPSSCSVGPTRPTPRKTAVAEQAAARVAAGGPVWFGEETTVRAFPPLRACWATRGRQREVVISGRNGRRVIHGALNAASGDFVSLIRERSRQDDCLALVQALGHGHPDVPQRLYLG